jgi:hypothetical protein
MLDSGCALPAVDDKVVQAAANCVSREPRRSPFIATNKRVLRVIKKL